jgi:hypothetical protein
MRPAMRIVSVTRMYLPPSFPHFSCLPPCKMNKLQQQQQQQHTLA